MDKGTSEIKKWQKIKDYIGNERIELGPYLSYQLRHAPRRALFILSHYKFAAKLLGEGKEILEVGCAEGLGTLLLAEFAKKVVAIDTDSDSINVAQKNFASNKISFSNTNFLGARIGKFDGLVSFDVIEHIFPKNERLFFSSICQNLKRNGLCIIGTPNKTSEQYASEVTKLGHVNLYTWDKLKKIMEKYFNQVFIFSANDEMVHTGFYPMAQYLIGVGVALKRNLKRR